MQQFHYFTNLDLSVYLIAAPFVRESAYIYSELHRLRAQKIKCAGELEISRLEGDERIQVMIKIVFVCDGNILKSPEKACKIDCLTVKQDAYYTTTIPFLKEP